MDQHVGHAALDRIEIAEPGVAGVEPLDQLDDAVFEAAQRELIALAQLHAVEPLAERMHRRFEIGRHGAAAFHQRRNPRLQPGQRFVAAGVRGGVLEPGGEAVHLGGELRQRAVGGDVRADVAHRRDRFLELMEHRGFRAACRRSRELVDLVRQAAHRVLEADQIFRRRQVAQRVADLGEPLLQAGQRGGIAAGLPAAADALGQRADLAFQRLDGVARHRVLQRAADLGEVAAQRRQRVSRRAGAARRSAW